MSHQATFLHHRSSGVPDRRKALFGRAARERLVVGLFAVFVSGTSGGLTAFAPASYEAIFWFFADVLILTALVTRDAYLKHAIVQNPILVLWPTLAILSALWSYSPMLSFYHGAQLLMTVLIGFYICSLLDLRRVLISVMLGLALTQLASLAAVFLHLPTAIGDDGAWIGSYPHKNVLGFTMVFQALICVSLWRDRTVGRLSWLCLPLALILLVMSKSATSILSLTSGLLPFLIAPAMKRGTNATGMVVGILIFVAAALLFLVLSGTVDLEGAVLGGLGKDSTLTGRTELWRFGVDQFWKAPFIGIGYQAYWDSTLTSSAYLRYVIHQDLWFFHNNFVDVAVAFGCLGLAVFASGLLFSIARAVRLALPDGDWIDLWRISFMGAVVVQLNAEGPLFTNHSLVQAFFAIAVAPKLVRNQGPDAEDAPSGR